MLFNFEKNRVKASIDCIDCEYFDEETKKCLGIGKNCFEYDEKTRTCLDPITKLPINLDKIKKGEE